MHVVSAPVSTLRTAIQKKLLPNVDSLRLVLFDTLVKHLVDFSFRLNPIFEGTLTRKPTPLGEVIGCDLNHFMAGIRTDTHPRYHPDSFSLNPTFMGAMTAQSELSGVVTKIVRIHFLANIGVINCYIHVCS
jgi:hypothetical protein